MADQQNRGGKKTSDTGKRHGDRLKRPPAGEPGGPKPTTFCKGDVSRGGIAGSRY